MSALAGWPVLVLTAGLGTRLQPLSAARAKAGDTALRTGKWAVQMHGAMGFTVYVPTAPIPTAGFVYHLPAGQVEILKGVPIQAAMRMIIACGGGAADLVPAAAWLPR
mgnify:CR=1 FL=1